MVERSPSLLLVLDTVGPELMAGLIDLQGGMLAQIRQTSSDQRHHSASLIPALKQLFIDCRQTPAELAGAVMVTGPGSFTGIRTVLTCARTLAQTLAIPLIPLSTFQIWALGGMQVSETPFTAMLDARRGRVYKATLQWKTCLFEDNALLPYPALLGAVTCQPLDEMVKFQNTPCIASPNLIPDLALQVADIHPPPQTPTPEIIAHWVHHQPLKVLLKQLGKPWHSVHPIYGQVPNITLPKTPHFKVFLP